MEALDLANQSAAVYSECEDEYPESIWDLGRRDPLLSLILCGAIMLVPIIAVQYLFIQILRMLEYFIIRKGRKQKKK